MTNAPSPKTVSLTHFQISNTLPFILIAGPCVLESQEHALDVAGEIHRICTKLDIPFIFKTSFDKANRTSVNSPRGLGIQTALATFEKVKKTYGCPVLTDVHHPEQCAEVASVVDVLQIPAFLCRQTDLVVAAAQTGRVLNIKKGQFLAPQDMAHVAAKAVQAGNEQILLCERGASFGYHTLVSDFRAVPIMAQTGYPIIFDATHSVQQPGGLNGKSGGDRRFVEPLARAAMAVGVAGVFIETHPQPDQAPSDGPNMVPLSALEGLLHTLKDLDSLSKTLTYQEIA